MTTLQQARDAIYALADLAAGNPDPVSVLKVQGDLVRLHYEVGQEMTRSFHGKERSYITRKINQAKAYQHGRRELKLTGGDATEEAILAAGEDWNRENDAAAEYEGMRVLLKSLQNALDYSRQLVSFIKTAESNA